MANVAVSVLAQFGIVLNGLTNQLGGFGSGTESQPGKLEDDRYNATGGLYSASQATSLGIVGEAGTETVAILRNPRALMGEMGGNGGSFTINFGDIYVRNDQDINRIAQAVMQAMGQRASLVGLRSVG